MIFRWLSDPGSLSCDSFVKAFLGGRWFSIGGFKILRTGLKSVFTLLWILMKNPRRPTSSLAVSTSCYVSIWTMLPPVYGTTQRFSLASISAFLISISISCFTAEEISIRIYTPHPHWSQIFSTTIHTHGIYPRISVSFFGIDVSPPQLTCSGYDSHPSTCRPRTEPTLLSAFSGNDGCPEFFWPFPSIAIGSDGSTSPSISSSALPTPQVGSEPRPWLG